VYARWSLVSDTPLFAPFVCSKQMKTSVIRQRVADFLRCHVPFDSLAPQDLLDLAGSGKVRFHQSEEYVQMKGDKPNPLIWVVQQERLEVMRESAGSEALVDVLGEGDLIGLEQFSGDGICQHSIRTLGDVLLYGVDAKAFQALSKRYVEVQRFLQAGFSIETQLGLKRTSWLDAEPPPSSFLAARAKRLQLSAQQELSSPIETRRFLTEMLHREVDTVKISGSAKVVRSSDIALFCGYDPPRLVREIEASDSQEELEPLLRLSRRMVREAMAEPQDIADCHLIASAITDSAIKAAIRIADAQSSLCWTVFGAAARMDLPYPQLPSLACIGDGEPAVASSLRTFGLPGQEMPWPQGLERPRSLDDWLNFFSQTLADPLENSIYLRREWFDMRAVGSAPAMADKLQSHIAAQLKDNELAIALLANDTLDHLPPLTFFEGLVVGLDGSRRESFDIEKTIVEPIADAARVFALATGRLERPSTLERLKDAGEFFREAAEAFRIGVHHQALAGSRMIHPGKLGKLDQKLLKTAIASVQRLLAHTVRTFVEGQ